MRHAKLFLAAASVALLTSGCIISTEGIPGHVGRPGADGQPVVEAFTYSPFQATKDDTITFTVVATDPEGQPLQHTWSATKGTLTSTSGTMVAWRPVKADGSIDAGLATVMVLVSDGRMSRASSVNIHIASDGTAKVEPLPSASPTAAPTASPAASASPSASPRADASASPSPAASATASPAR